MADKTTNLALGTYTFADFAIPEKVTVQSRQTVVNHELVGGTKVVDAMGRYTDPITWSGWFLGANAVTNARQLEAFLSAGVVMPLSFSNFKYQVVVSEFKIDFERPYQISYSITCTVVSSDQNQTTGTQDIDANAAIKTDMNGLAGLAASFSAQVNNLVTSSGLTGAMATLQSAVSSVSSFANAAQSTINSVLAPLRAVQAQVQTLITSAGNTVLNVTTLGGLLPNNPLAVNAANLASQVGAFTQLPLLYNLKAVAGRMGANLNSVTAGVATYPTAGGNLMQIAAAQYGDATQWPTIAKANNLIDPVVSGLANLVIPPASTNQANGGVLVS